MNGLFVAISLAIIAAVSAADTECYTCTETLSGITEMPTVDCLDAFKENGDPDSIEKKKCTAKQNNCFKSITQTYQTGSEGRFISSYSIKRGCMNSTVALDDHCDEGKAAQGYQATCYCKGNNCNGSALLYSSIFTVSLGLLAALLR